MPSRRIAAIAACGAVLMAVAPLAHPVPLAAVATPADVITPPPPKTPAQLTRNPRTGRVVFVSGEAGGALTAAAPTASHEAAARGFLSAYGELFGLSANSAVSLTRQSPANFGITANRFQQTYKGIPIFGGEVIVRTRTDRSVLDAGGQLSPVADLDTTPRLSAAEAAQIALADTARLEDIAVEKLAVEDASLAIYNPSLLKPAPNLNQLVWRVNVTATTLDPVRRSVLVDATRGGVALNLSRIADARNRLIYDTNRSSTLPGTLTRSEGQAASAITDVNNAYDYLGDTYDFYATVHGRDSIDGAGMSLVATTRYCPTIYDCPYGNAYWDGSQMVFGEGFASADDVVAHELTHGVTERESNLFYYYQSGAINEAFSDVWGEFVDLTNGRGTDTPAVRWLLGEDLSIGYIRNMKNPPDKLDPDMMSSTLYACDGSDNGGVHTNSGVLNKAVYLMVDGDTFNNKTVTGIGITATAKILYLVQTSYLTSASDYLSLYNSVNSACSVLQGSDGITAATCAAVKNALDAVEMNQQAPAACAAPEAAVCPAGVISQTVFFDDLENTYSGNWVATSSGSGQGSYGTGYSTSGSIMLWLRDNATTGDAALAMSSSKAIPANAFFHFDHAHEFDSYSTAKDGGVVEYSTDGGTTWNDAGVLFDANGYNDTLDTLVGTGNPLAGRSAFGRSSNGYMSSRLNLGPLAGQSVRFRFRVGTDNSGSDYGWFIDNPQIYTCTAWPRAWMPMANR